MVSLGLDAVFGRTSGWGVVLNVYPRFYRSSDGRKTNPQKNISPGVLTSGGVLRKVVCAFFRVIRHSKINIVHTPILRV